MLEQPGQIPSVIKVTCDVTHLPELSPQMSPVDYHSLHPSFTHIRAKIIIRQGGVVLASVLAVRCDQRELANDLRLQNPVVLRG